VSVDNEIHNEIFRYNEILSFSNRSLRLSAYKAVSYRKHINLVSSGMSGRVYRTVESITNNLSPMLTYILERCPRRLAKVKKGVLRCLSKKA
jgi:hypothetical protein